MTGSDSRPDGVLAKPVSARPLHAELARCLGLGDAPGARPGAPVGAVSAQAWLPLRGLDILLVEDIDVNQEVMAELLGSVGLHCRLAGNGREALAEIARQRPDVVLMDCQMPVMDGFEATRHLRADPSTRTLPIIALTANATADDQARCLAAGMDAHVAKPIQLAALHATLANCLPAAARPDGTAVLTPPVICPPGTAAQAQTCAPDDARGPLPDLPGIDATRGLAHVDGRTELYYKLLQRFAADLGRHFPERFRAGRQVDAGETAARLAHSLRGVALTLGATALGELAAELETACASAPGTAAGSEPGIEAALARVEQALAIVLAGIEQLAPLAPAPSSGGTVAADDIDTLRTRLATLDTLLAGRDTAAQEAVATITPLWAQTPWQHEWRALAEAVDGLRFAPARKILSTLQHSLDAIQAENNPS